MLSTFLPRLSNLHSMFAIYIELINNENILLNLSQSVFLFMFIRFCEIFQIIDISKHVNFQNLESLQQWHSILNTFNFKQHALLQHNNGIM
jgi:hypothetical protein